MVRAFKLRASLVRHWNGESIHKRYIASRPARGRDDAIISYYCETIPNGHSHKHKLAEKISCHEWNDVGVLNSFTNFCIYLFSPSTHAPCGAHYFLFELCAHKSLLPTFLRATRALTSHHYDAHSTSTMATGGPYSWAYV